eukprot:11462156-Alexandrium_andersonii.AAC.1
MVVDPVIHLVVFQWVAVRVVVALAPPGSLEVDVALERLAVAPTPERHGLPQLWVLQRVGPDLFLPPNPVVVFLGPA